VTATLGRALLLWLLLSVLAMLNGILREQLLNPLFGEAVALPLSGISLSLLVFAVSYLGARFLRARGNASYLLIGLLWVSLTLAFECLFGHWGLGRSWAQIGQVFDLASGNLFLLVLLSSACSPWLAARIKGLI